MKKRTLYGEVPNLVGQRFGKLFVVSSVNKKIRLTYVNVIAVIPKP
jgi:hypothetical protein